MQESLIQATTYVGAGARIMPDTPPPSSLSSGTFPVLATLALVLFCAGCFGTPDTGKGTAVLPGNETGQVEDLCTFDHLIGDAELHLTNGDACYFNSHTPMDFLDDLRMHPDTQVMVIDVPDNWITHADAELLMQEIDSPETAAPVVSPISSYWPFNRTSTVGNEALFLLEGYRTGKYPPGLCSLSYFESNRTEVRVWWDTHGKWNFPEERESVRIVQDSHPELKGYPSDTFPPRSIRTEKTPEGWYVAFIQEGSGLPILSARCYCVGNDRNVTLTGTVNHSIMVMVQDFSPKRCG